MGGSVLVPLLDASAKDTPVTDIVRADATDAGGGDVTDAGGGDVTDVGGGDVTDAGGDVATIDAPADVPDADAMASEDAPADASDTATLEDAGDACAVSEINCSGICHDISSDPANCGACGHACVSAEVCTTGFCMPGVPPSPSGCADGTREAFNDTTMFPNIAACAGGFSVAGVFPTPTRVGSPTCATSGNTAVLNPGGAGCSASDLCGTGWHVCRGAEVGPFTGGRLCAATSFTPNEFYAAAVSGNGCDRCALPTYTTTAGCTSTSCTVRCRESNDLTNGLFGCGTGRPSVDCELTVTAGDRCADVPGATWTCPSDTNESATVTKASAAGGGVLCCRG